MVKYLKDRETLWWNRYDNYEQRMRSVEGTSSEHSTGVPKALEEWFKAHYGRKISLFTPFNKQNSIIMVLLLESNNRFFWKKTNTAELLVIFYEAYTGDIKFEGLKTVRRNQTPGKLFTFIYIEGLPHDTRWAQKCSGKYVCNTKQRVFYSRHSKAPWHRYNPI